jgi:hypothetical protein
MKYRRRPTRAELSVSVLDNHDEPLVMRYSHASQTPRPRYRSEATSEPRGLGILRGLLLSWSFVT